MDGKNILEPVLAMFVLHAAVWLWMTITRGVAMSRAGISLEQARHTADLQQLPDPSRQVADNYNHLFELPTVFYALVFYIWAMGHADLIHVACAWSFFGSRVVHSVVQGTVNRVALRFPIFAFGWVIIVIMILRELF